jgi:hypothetical protein
MPRPDGEADDGYRGGRLAPAGPMTSILPRLWKVLRGEGRAFEEISHDRQATMQALVITAVASAIGQFTIDANMPAFVLGAVSGSIGLFAWSSLLWANARILGGSAGLLQTIRGIGFAAAPFVLIGLPIIGIAAVVYSVALQVAAIKHIHRLNTGRAMLAVVMPWVLLVLGVALSLEAAA